MPPLNPYTGPTPSLLPITAGSEKAAWDAISKATEGRLTLWGTDLLRSGLDKHVKSVLVEPLYICKDYRNLYANFYSKKFSERSSYCSRLHFFNTDALSAEEAIFHPETYKDNYMGYSVIEPVARRCVGRTVVDPYMIGQQQKTHFCLRTPTKVRIHGADYETHGFPYRSQSGEATVCAHTALWAACRYLSERYREYRELHPYDLIEMTGDTNGRRVPYRGMSYTDYSTILSEFGCHPAILRPKGTEITGGGGKKTRDWSMDRESFFDLYSYVESGFPVLTSFGGHVVTLIGHTILDALPGGKVADKHGFYDSAYLVKEYIVVDDNFFPYQLLGYRGSAQYYPAGAYGTMEHPPSIDAVVAAVVPLPEKAFLPPRFARESGSSVFATASAQAKIADVVKKLALKDETLKLIRLLLTSGSAFHRRKREFYNQNTKDDLLKYPVSLNLPHFVWVLELSTLSTHNARRCFGEIVVDATSSRHEYEPIYVRIGNHLISGNKEQEFASCPLDFPQYTHNLGRL